MKDARGNALGRLVMLHDLEASRQADLGRTRMKQGDCKGALDSFDAALKGSNDPLLHRDRGLCHENLGHPVPAMQDYRAYLTVLPDANDADNIRERLERLQGDTRAADAAREAEAKRKEDASTNKATWKSTMNVNASTNAGVSASTSASVMSDEPEPETATGTSKELSGKEAAQALEKKEAAELKNLESNTSALRRGRGPVIGVVAGPRWFQPETGSTRGGYLIGGTLRYSTGPVLTALLDIGYTGTTNDEGTASAFGGLALMAGAEARIALNSHVSDALLVGAGIGYERMKQSSLGIVISSVVPRARVGYRHVFGPTFGLEATFDAGYALGTVVDSDQTANNLVFGPNVGVVTGF